MMGSNRLTDTSDEQEVVYDTNSKFENGWAAKKYVPELCGHAYDILSSGSLKTKAHLCAAFYCSKPTVNNWIRRYPDFREAVERGLAAGEKLFRDEIATNAFMPTSGVNNGLIKMMAANVYGIKEESAPVVVVQSRTERTAEEEMKERNIPLPDIDSMDLDDMAAVSSEEIAEIEEGEAGQRNNDTPQDSSRISGESLLEIVRLRAMVKAQREVLNAAKEIEQNRGIKGFGTDFESSDEGIGASPFGLGE